MQSQFSMMKKNVSSLITAIGGSILSAIPFLLVVMFFTLPLFQNKIVEYKKKSVRVAVESAYNTLDYYYKKEQAHEMTREEAQKWAGDVIRNLRYQEKEYFWINDLSPKMIMHPFKPELNGKDVSQIADPTGKKIFVEMAEIAKKDGAGYVDYMWPKPNEKDPSPKTSFVKSFEPWGWVIGSGVYSDDIVFEVNQIKKDNLFWIGAAFLMAVMISLFLGVRQLVKVIIPVQRSIISLAEESKLLNSSATGLSSVSQQLSATGQTQSSSVHETASAMTEMNEMIQKTSDSAAESSSLSEQTSVAAQDGLQALEKLNTAMNEISNAQNRSELVLEDNLKRLYDVTHIISKISDKTKIINEIVFQTKLLSFNASVEAARAGEYGKGFAVVAQEVGNLAQLSGASAQEISQIVSDSNKQVLELTETIKKDLTNVIRDIQVYVKEGQTYSNVSLETLNTVVGLASKASEMSKNISAANVEQSKGSQEATQALRVMETTSQQMEEVVVNTEKEARSLVEQAGHLHDITQSLEKIIGDRKKAA